MTHPGSCGASVGPAPTGSEPLPPAPGELRILPLASPADVCQGAEFSAEFRVQSEPGQAYVWSLREPPPGLSLNVEQGEQVRLSGQPSLPGAYTWDILVTDQAGAVGRLSLSLQVRERPSIRTAELPSICPGEIYRAPLFAEGGTGVYSWTTSFPERSGLRVQGAELEGRYAGSESVGLMRVELGVSDGFCEASSRSTLEVLAAASEHCPAIEVAGASASELPAPCLGNEYLAQLSVRQAGAAAGYQWEPVQVPPGLVFDPSSASLHGRATGAGELVVQLTDAEPRRLEAHFPVTPRSKCWFGYVAGEPGARRLQLLDPRLESQPAARRAYPASASPGADVLDFAFSPRGRFLAYRLQDAVSAQLWLLNLHTWQEQLLELGGSVQRYSWGPAAGDSDAIWLAVSWSSQGEDRLGAVNLAGVPADPLDGVAAPGISGLSYAASATGTLLSAPLWLSATESAAFAPDPVDPVQWMVQVARYDLAGVALAPPHDELTFDQRARLQRGYAGVFVIDETSQFRNYFPSDGQRFAAHGVSAIVSPSGRFVGRVREGQLELFRGTDPSWSDLLPAWAAAPGCDTLLAWAEAAEGRERIACARANAGTQELVFYDLPDPVEPRLVELPRVQGEYRYLTGEQIGLPRLFSPQGDRFAFATNRDVYVAKLDDGTPRIDRSFAGDALGAPLSALAFSPNGEVLSLNAGSDLTVWSLTRSETVFVRLPVEAAPAAACTEEFTGPELRWCGLPAAAPPLLWSAPGDVFVYRNAAGSLEIEDAHGNLFEQMENVELDVSCGAACLPADGYAFQP